MRSISIFLPVHQPTQNLGSTPVSFPQKVVKGFEAFVRDRAIFMVRSHADQMLGFDPNTQHAPALRRYDIVLAGEEEDIWLSEVLARAIVDFAGQNGSVMTQSAGYFAAIDAETAALIELGEDPWFE